MATSRSGRAAAAFEAFVARAWADHAGRADAVARRLQRRTPPPRAPQHLTALVSLVVHVLAEHLGRFDDARWRLAALASHPLADDSVRSALRVAQAALDWVEREGPLALDGAETVRALASAASICLGRGDAARALQSIDDAAARLAALPGATPQDHRPLAVACNNMAWELHDLGTARTEAQTRAMLRLAAASREHWSHAGTWLQIERADYCLALTHLSAGRHDDAWRHAAQCLAVCLRHEDAPVERFGAHEAMARVHHARGEAAEFAHHVDEMAAALERMEPAAREASRSTLEATRRLKVA